MQMFNGRPLHPDDAADLEAEFFYENESMQALRLSRSEGLTDDEPEIAQELAKGRFVVFEEGEVYCPRTDAIMGSKRTFVDSFENRADAELLAAEKHKAMEKDEVYEYTFGVLPYVPVPRPAPVSTSDDEVPF
jgi:hypothetical protein